jgi:hypothetical protein
MHAASTRREITKKVADDTMAEGSGKRVTSPLMAQDVKDVSEWEAETDMLTEFRGA